MKTRINPFFVLQAFCNLGRNNPKPDKRKWNILIVLLGFMLLLPFSKVHADYSYKSGDITFSANTASMTIKFLGMDKNGVDDELDDLKLYYLDPNTSDWVRFYWGDYDDGDHQDLFDGPDITNVSGSSSGDLKYVVLTYNYPKGLFPSNAIIKAEVDWDIDSNDTNTGTDNTFYYTVKGVSEVSWNNFWSYSYNYAENKIDFNFLICDIYGDGEVSIDQHFRHELDDIVLDYSIDGGTNWVQIFQGDCRKSATDIILGEFSRINTGTFTKNVTKDGSSDRYIGHVMWSNIPSTLSGKLIKFRARSDWDLFADQNQAEFNAGLEKTVVVNFPSIEIKTSSDGCTYSHENEKVVLKWDAITKLSNPIIKYYIKRSLKDKTTGKYSVPIDLKSEGFTEKEFTDATILPWNEYKYTVYAVPTLWGWTLDPNYSISYTVSTSPNTPKFENFILTAFPTVGFKQPYVKIDWKTEWVKRNLVTLYHRPSTSTVFSKLEVISPEVESYIDNEVTDNSKHFYKIEVDIDGHIFEKIDSITVEKKVTFKSIHATKNTIGDRIQLSWEIDRLDLCDRFEIYRSYTRDSSGIDISTTPEMVNQISAQTVYNKWDDMTAVSGVVYAYKIKAYKTGDDGLLRTSESTSDIGFRTPIGIISGRITYNGGTSVDSVSVYVESSTLDDNMLYKSLMFKGESSQKCQVDLTNAQHGCIKNGFSFQSWLTSSRSTAYTPVFEVQNEYSIGVRNDEILVFIGEFDLSIPSITCKLDSTIMLNDYFHLSVTLNTNDSLKIYINGNVKATVKLPESVSSYNCTFLEQDFVDGTVTTEKTKCYIGNNTNGSSSNVKPYSGNIDDVRLWSRGISDKEILSNFNRYLSGSESGLIGYWPLDEGISSYAFDCSKTNQKFNEHHIQLFQSYTSSLVPAQNQLAIKGLTDKDGNYIIRGIPFTGSGSTYSLHPILGTHTFEPTQLVRYISPSSLIHNSSDFIDKSSFKVKVKITYENTTYPVSGVNFFVDGNPCARENVLLATNELGECTLDVPIGEHYIRAQMTGHTFQYDGRYPNLGTIVYDESSSAGTITFTDQTQVIVTGRVVGGTVEAAYKLGFKKSHANIGQATLELQPAAKTGMYNLNKQSTGNRTLANDATNENGANENGANRFNSVATIEPEKDKVIIKTDPVTGEYMVKLPPIEWQVNTVSTILPTDNSKSIEIIEKPQSFTTNPLFTEIDTATIENKTDSFKYNVNMSFTYRVAPKIQVADVGPYSNGKGGFGESKYLVQDKTTLVVDTLNLYSISDEGLINYPYSNQKPIFIQAKPYTFRIEAFEEYVHPDISNTTMKLYSKVPLTGAKVTVENEIGKLVKSAIPNAADDTIPTHIMELKAGGIINYQFLGGFPNLTDINAGFGLKIYVDYENKQYGWDQNATFSGIILGAEPIAGTNFVTNGPLVPLIVLRDPPGSNSYAYMETGTTVSYSFSNKTSFNTNHSAKGTIKGSPDVTMALGGFGVMVITEIETEAEGSMGVEGEFARFKGTTKNNSLTLTERIQTSSSPDFVGSNADVYIGTSTNVFYSECNVLNINKNTSGGYELEKNIESRGNIKAATDFRFSQNEILTAQIPIWQKKIKEILITKSESEYNLLKTQPSTTGRNSYITTLISSDIDKFGMDASSYSIMRPAGENLTNEVDSMANQIRSWQNVIASNEATKDLAKTKTDIYELKNISFDAGATVERSYTFTEQDGTVNGDNMVEQAVIGGKIGFTVNGVGVETELETKIGGGRESESSNDNEKTITFGYVFEDPDADNRFSVNVYQNKFLSSEASALNNDKYTKDYVESSVGSYIFELAGGQSSCPYEREDSTLFYSKNNKLIKLANGSQPLDAPYIRIQDYNKTNIPNGKDATYSLELGSNSIVQTPRAYMLSVVDSTNRDGAIISVDGTPLTSGRLFYVAPGQILSKTLTLHQTKPDVLDYKGIKLEFSSPCDGSIIAEQLINASYVPSCSDLDLSLNRQLLNKETGTDLTLTLKNFNQTYKNFLGLKIEYKEVGESENYWKGITFTKKGIDISGLSDLRSDMIIPEEVSSMDYTLSFNGKIDGNYQVRAFTLCQDGLNIVNNFSEEYLVVKDMVAPGSMGTPSPSNGILTPETEVAVSFSENIQTGMLVSDNFEVQAVLNGATLQHAEGLALDGTAKSEAFTESPISLQNSSFAIEAWVRTASDCTNFGNLFSIGEGDDKVVLQMNKEAIQLVLNNQIINQSIAIKSDWQYVSLNYNATTKLIEVHLMNSISSSTVISQKLTKEINPVGRLLVGTGYKGNIHQLVVWNQSRSIGDLTDINVAKSGKERDIIAYWPLDEATGTLAADKARSRNMTVNSSWFIEPSGKSAVFDGTNQSALLKTSAIPITTNDNFSLEFWFKGKMQTNATLFSCGKGIGDLKPDDKLAVGFNETGIMSLNSNGIGYPIPGASVLDTLWHHFALSVTRGANSNIYIDGQQKLQIASGKIGGMASDKIAIGSRRYAETDETYQQDQYFNGSMDELRIWKSALSADNFRLDMQSKLTGKESGLIAYYPFEEYIADSGNRLQVVASLKDCAVQSAGRADSLNLTFSSNTPAIKVPRPKEPVSFNWTASDNKIVFNVVEPLSKIENCVLEFSINKVLDKNGNSLASPIKWTAFVDNNRLNWETEQVNLSKQVLDASTFTAVIVNNSGKYENYLIDGLPGWLSVNKSSGKLNPLEKTELTFTIDNATNIGSYETRITLTGNNGIQEMLPVSLKITGTRPDWSVNPFDYESSMNVIGQVQIGGVYQEDTEDMLAAFIGTRCVGIATPQFDKNKNAYLLYMDIYSSTGDNAKALSFSLWDAGTGRIYPGVTVIGNPLSYISTSIVGTINEPQVFNATDKIEQQLSLKQGWNWISSNVVSTEPSLITQFKTGIESSGEQLKSRSGYMDYTNGNWIGSDPSITIDQTSMYMLKINQAKTLKMEGAMAKPAELSLVINKFWNWIGYVPQFVAPVKEALSALEAKEGDQIKGQIGFASYSGGAWYGSLQYMRPGLGYMYYSTNSVATHFNYPSQYLSQSKVAKQSEDNSTMKWAVDVNKYQMSMTVTGVVGINSKEVANSDLQVAVFVGEECRGTAVLKYVENYGRYMAFLMIWGNTEDVNKEITFKSFNPADNQELTAINQSLLFAPDNITGTPANPYPINYVISGNIEQNMDKLKVYPNPVIDVLHFDFDPSGIEQLEIIDNVGSRLIGYTEMTRNTINVGNLVPGVYTLRIKYNGKVFVHLFIKK